MSRSAVILRIFIAKPPIAAGTNSLSTTNEKRTTQCPTKFSETRTVQDRTHDTQTIYRRGDEQSAPDTGILNGSIPAAADMPRRSGFPKGSGEVLERDRGSKSPVSFQPPPRGVNKIYKSDTVFYIGENNTNNQSKTQFPYLPPRGANEIYTYDVVFPIAESKTNNQSKPQLPYK